MLAAAGTPGAARRVVVLGLGGLEPRILADGITAGGTGVARSARRKERRSEGAAARHFADPVDHHGHGKTFGTRHPGFLYDGEWHACAVGRRNARRQLLECSGGLRPPVHCTAGGPPIRWKRIFHVDFPTRC